MRHRSAVDPESTPNIKGFDPHNATLVHKTADAHRFRRNCLITSRLSGPTQTSHMNLAAILTAALLAVSTVAITDSPISPTNSSVTPSNSGTSGTDSLARLGRATKKPTQAPPLNQTQLSTRHTTDDFDWPTSSSTVLRQFDHLENNWNPGHRGVDLASRPDEEIRAAGPGMVVYAGRVVDNNVVSIEHATGLRTTYMPVSAWVDVGDYVHTGDIIGTIEEGHCLLGACLHWGAKRGDTYYNPLSLLGGVDIRLYPVGG